MKYKTYGENVFNIDEQAFLTAWQRDDQFKFVYENCTVIFIHQPKIKNLVDTHIDLLLIVAVEDVPRRFVRFDNEHYFNNIIMPIRFIRDYTDQPVRISHNGGDLSLLMVDDKMDIEVNDIVSNLTFATKQYLESVWDVEKLRIFPLVWVIGPNKQSYDFQNGKVIYAPEFGFYEWKACLAFGIREHITSFWGWRNITANSHKNLYPKMDEQIESLLKQIENDQKIGALTKKKLDQIAENKHKDDKEYEKYLSQKNSLDDGEFVLGVQIKQKKLENRILAYPQLDKHLVLISGKAGSGKTTELMLLMKKAVSDNKRVRVFMYNRMLKYEFDIAARKLWKTSPNPIFFRTIHQQIYKMTAHHTAGLRLCQIMGISRIKQLCSDLDRKFNHINEIVEKYFPASQAHILSKLSAAEREIYLKFSNSKNERDWHNEWKGELQRQKDKISGLVGKDIFLTDYFQVVRNLMMAINEPDVLFDYLKIDELSDEEWHELWEKQGDYLHGKSRRDAFKERINRSLGGFRSAFDVLLIDEGQDFHALERDWILQFFGRENIVVSTGGQEQLVRLTEPCDWTVCSSYRFNQEQQKLEVIQTQKNSVFEIKKQKKSYRLKPELVNLCNFIATHYEIDLGLECEMHNGDMGRVFIDYGNGSGGMGEQLRAVVQACKGEGERNQLSPYESMMFLMNSGSDVLFNKMKVSSKRMQINEHDNVEEYESDNINLNCRLPEMLSMGNEAFYWYFAGNQDEPIHGQYRGLYYESCRGLEAWSVFCLEIDAFFEMKKQEEQAAQYLANDLFLDEEQRRTRYAAHWVLLALTRAIDTLYIHVKDSASELGQLLIAYQQAQKQT